MGVSAHPYKKKDKNQINTNKIMEQNMTTIPLNLKLAKEINDGKYKSAQKDLEDTIEECKKSDSLKEQLDRCNELLKTCKEKKKEADPQIEVSYQQLEERIKSIVGTKVAIQHKNKNKGKIEIEYYSQAELERLIDLFESIKES